MQRAVQMVVQTGVCTQRTVYKQTVNLSERERRAVFVRPGPDIMALDRMRRCAAQTRF